MPVGSRRLSPFHDGQHLLSPSLFPIVPAMTKKNTIPPYIILTPFWRVTTIPSLSSCFSIMKYPIPPQYPFHLEPHFLSRAQRGNIQGIGLPLHSSKSQPTI